LDQQTGGVIADVRPNAVRSVLVFAWGIVAVFVYGSIAIVSSLVSKRFARAVAKLWCVHLLAIAGIRIAVTGIERLDRSRKFVFVSNHQSGIDIPLLVAALPRFLSFIAKKELFFIPFFGWGMAAVGHVWIDRSNPRKARESISRAVRMIKTEDLSLVIFPEGTRTETGEIGEFKKGAFTLPIEAGVDLLPVAIRGTQFVLPKHETMVRPGTVYLDIGAPVSVEGAGRGDKADLAEKVRAVIVAMAENPTA
jgi:1-acyl-sn-glycerol-3-phosphate acyltransferase